MMRYATTHENQILDDATEAALSEIGWTDEARAAALESRRRKSKGKLTGVLGKGFGDKSKRDTLAQIARLERGQARFDKRKVDPEEIESQYRLQRKVDAHDAEAKLIGRRQDRLYVRPTDRPKWSDPYYTSWWNEKGERDPQGAPSRKEVVKDTADTPDSFFDRAEGERRSTTVSSRIKAKGKIDARVKMGPLSKWPAEASTMQKRLRGERWRNRRRRT